jgi:hypothetical protein
LAGATPAEAVEVQLRQRPQGRQRLEPSGQPRLVRDEAFKVLSVNAQDIMPIVLPGF